MLLAFATWVSITWEPGRRIVVAGVALAGLVALVHGRPGYGRRRGLPPGSLSLATSLDAIDDRRFYVKAAARWGPVFKMRQIHQPVVCITDLPTGLEVLRISDDALIQSDWSFNRLVPGGYLEFMNGDAHARYRGILAAAFTSDIVDAWQETIIAAARRQLAELARSQERDGVDPEPVLLHGPLTSLIGMVLGVAPADARFDSLTSLFVKLNEPIELFLPIPRSNRHTYAELTSLVTALARSPLEVPSVLANIVRADPAHADDQTLIGNLVLMVKEGSMMVRGLLRWVLRALAEHEPSVRSLRDLREAPQKLDALATAFVLETLRRYETRYVYRVAAREVTIGRYRVPKGWLIRLCLDAAHEHADRFPDPGRFDPTRFVGPRPEPGSFCPFGSGRHACLGADVTLVIASAFVREAALAYDVRIREDGPAWRINRHWGLWRPSPRFRVAVTPSRRTAR